MKNNLVLIFCIMQVNLVTNETLNIKIRKVVVSQDYSWVMSVNNDVKTKRHEQIEN